MQNNLEKQKHFVLFLLEADERQFTAIFKTLLNGQIAVIQEIVYNVLQGSLNLTENQLTILRKHRKLLRGIPSNKSLLAKNPKTLYKIFKVLRIVLNGVISQ